MKIKEFIKKHKSEIIVGTVVGSTIIAAVLVKKSISMRILQKEGEQILTTLTNDHKAIGRTAEEIVDFILNVGENDKFAIFKETELYEIVKL